MFRRSQDRPWRPWRPQVWQSGNLAIAEPDTKGEGGGGVTVKELVVGTPWYQNERYEFHMACHAWLKASCIEKGGRTKAKRKNRPRGGGGEGGRRVV